MAFFKKLRAKSNIDISEENQSEAKNSKPVTLNEASNVNDNMQRGESVYSECMDLIGAFSLKDDFFDSEMERKVYNVLKNFINKEYFIIPHVSLREVFKWDWSLNEKITNTVPKMHFDFGIYDSNYLPIMFIEVCGSEHNKNEKTKAGDAFKKELLGKHDLKLIVIDASKSIKEQEISSIVIQQIKNEIQSREDYHVYCPKCHSAMYLKYNTKDETYFYGCSTYNPERTNNCSGCSISKIPPLYHSILDTRKVKK